MVRAPRSGRRSSGHRPGHISSILNRTGGACTRPRSAATASAPGIGIFRVNSDQVGNFSGAVGARAGILEAFKNHIKSPGRGQLAWSSSPGRCRHRRYGHLGGRHGDRVLWRGVPCSQSCRTGFNLRGISSNKFQIIMGAADLRAMIANTILHPASERGPIAVQDLMRADPTTEAAK